MYKKIVKCFFWSPNLRLLTDPDGSNKGRKSESRGIPVGFAHFRETRFAFSSAPARSFLQPGHQIGVR